MQSLWTCNGGSFARRPCSVPGNLFEVYSSSLIPQLISPQLFGDTMNTASRMQTTAKVGKIHVSQEFAELLTKSGRPNWTKPREESVQAKGLGVLKTYWLSASVSASDYDGSSRRDETQSSEICTKEDRLLDWTVDTLITILSRVAAYHSASALSQSADLKLLGAKTGTDFLSEVQEVVIMPDLQDLGAKTSTKGLGIDVAIEMKAYVSRIAGMYRKNHCESFVPILMLAILTILILVHNFEHASHVLLSVTKLMARIVAPSSTDIAVGDDAAPRDHTYGITSDPLVRHSLLVAYP